MTHADDAVPFAATDLDRAIATTLAGLLSAATARGASAATWSLARDAAQMLSMAGLDHALAVCSAHADGELPADAAALAERLARMAMVVGETGELKPLRDADDELSALADELGNYEWAAAKDGEAQHRATAATLVAAEVLDDVMLADDHSRATARRTRLAAPVAAAVRAALDWLSPPAGTPVLRLHSEPSALELRLDRIRTDRLYTVHRVIAAAGGSLGPMGGGAGWLLRVPSFAERPTYLLLVQGGLRIAVPWHGVLKLRIVSTRAASEGQWQVDHAVLPAFSPSTLESRERPVVLLGHGLKRAYLVADRLIWRMTAESCENEWGSPAAGLLETVSSEDGEVFWVADPARLLADMELPELAIEPGAGTAEPVLSEAHVVPLGVVAAAEVPAEPPAIAAPSAAAPAAEGKPEPAPLARALVADDSLTTRLVLARLLEQSGFSVDTVSRSAQLMERLQDSAWTVLFTDLELPDGAGPEWLRQVCRTAASCRHPVRVVALVRDGGDLDVARAAGIEDTLLKPFARESLGALLERHGWGIR